MNDRGPALDLSVDRASEVPLGTQLGWKLKTLVAVGALAPGDRLPGVRELAVMAAVNVNTVRAVYARLEEEGFISSRQGRGTFVAEQPPVHDELARIIAGAASEARGAGVDTRDLAAALFVATRSDPPGRGKGTPQRRDEPTETPRPEPKERDQRRLLRAEIAELEAELAVLEGLSSSESPPPRRPAGRILSAAELESVRDDLVRRLVEVREVRAEALRRVAERDRDDEERAREEAPARERSSAWRHGGQWTPGLAAGAARVVWTSS